MRGVLSPIGPEAPRVYWVRRIVALAIVVGVIVGIVAVVSSAFGGSAPDKDPAATDVTPTDTPTTPPPDAKCDEADVRVVLNMSPTKIAAGADAAIDVSVTNTAEHPCTVDVGDKSRVVTITSGKDRIWSSEDCEGPADSKLVLLAPETVNRTTVIWPGTRSTPECPESLPMPRPGTYKAVATLAGATSEELVFNIEKGE